MKKSVLFFLGITAFGLINAQNNNSSLIKKISKEANENRKRFSLFIEKNKNKLNTEQINDMQSKLAGFVGNHPVFGKLMTNQEIEALILLLYKTEH